MTRRFALLVLLAAPWAWGQTSTLTISQEPGTGGSSVVLDLAADGVNESTGLLELAVTGDTNGIFSEPTANKLLIDVGQAWPQCDAATTVPQAAVTAHEAALAIAWGQLTGVPATFDPSEHRLSHETGGTDAITALAGETITTGTVADARIASTITRDSELATHEADANAHHVPTVDTDDQTAPEVPYAPTTGADWTDPDPAEVGAGLDDLADRLTTEEAKADDDVPEAGDFGALALSGDVTSSGLVTTLAADTVGAAELADADLGQAAVSGGVVTVEGLQYGTAFPGTPATGDVFAVTDDSAAGACDSAAGAALSLCRWSGTAWVALGDGGGSAPAFADLTSGTNTTMAAVVGAGASLKVGSTGTIGASCIDSDGDGTCTVRQAGSVIEFDPGDDGTADFKAANGQLFSNNATVNFGVVASATQANYWLTNASSNGMGGASGTVALIVNSTSRITATATGATINGTLESLSLTPAAQTCTDTGDGTAGFLAITVAGRSNTEVTQADAAGGCTASLSETGATRGQVLVVSNVSNAGGTLNFADNAGVQEAGAGCSLGLHGVAVFHYITDRWLLRSCIPTN